MMLASFVSSQILTHISVDLITAIIGFALALFAIYSLFNFTFPINTQPIWQIFAGASSGLLSGMTGIQSTAIIYFASLDIERDEFVGAVDCCNIGEQSCRRPLCGRRQPSDSAPQL